MLCTITYWDVLSSIFFSFKVLPAESLRAQPGFEPGFEDAPSQMSPTSVTACQLDTRPSSKQLEVEVKSDITTTPTKFLSCSLCVALLSQISEDLNMQNLKNFHNCHI